MKRAAREALFVRLTERIEVEFDAVLPPRIPEPADPLRPVASATRSGPARKPAPARPRVQVPAALTVGSRDDEPWQRLVIHGEGEGRYRFHLIGVLDDQVTHQVQPPMIDRLIHGVLSNLRYDRAAARTLAELPTNQTKQQEASALVVGGEQRLVLLARVFREQNAQEAP